MEYIIYACPLGELSLQLEQYFARSLQVYGPNAAHGYMAHVTLTGFFQDQPAALPMYTQQLEAALQRHLSARPSPALEITGMQLTPEWHGLTLESDWIKRLIADFAGQAASTTRNGALRLKNWLHLSLAYQFPAEQHTPLSRLALDLVQPTSQVEWELRLYERLPEQRWTLHAAWPLD